MNFARIQDLTGADDGLNGRVADIYWFESEAEMRASVGDAVAAEFVIAPDDKCRGWLYRDGAFIDPETERNMTNEPD